eukprot:139454-Pelagomonas_calceolata.AAC.3
MIEALCYRLRIEAWCAAQGEPLPPGTEQWHSVAKAYAAGPASLRRAQISLSSTGAPTEGLSGLNTIWAMSASVQMQSLSSSGAQSLKHLLASSMGLSRDYCMPPQGGTSLLAQGSVLSESVFLAANVVNSEAFVCACGHTEDSGASGSGPDSSPCKSLEKAQGGRTHAGGYGQKIDAWLLEGISRLLAVSQKLVELAEQVQPPSVPLLPPYPLMSPIAQQQHGDLQPDCSADRP